MTISTFLNVQDCDKKLDSLTQAKSWLPQPHQQQSFYEQLQQAYCCIPWCCCWLKAEKVSINDPIYYFFGTPPAPLQSTYTQLKNIKPRTHAIPIVNPNKPSISTKTNTYTYKSVSTQTDPDISVSTHTDTYDPLTETNGGVKNKQKINKKKTKKNGRKKDLNKIEYGLIWQHFQQ